MKTLVASKGKPYRSVIVEGFEILIGKGDEENDRLTFEVADPDDLWLHVGSGAAGSHVVIRNPEKLDVVAKDVVRRAAELAAWHSKAREAGRVEVHVCRVSDVTKRRGAPAGEVMLRRWDRVRVYPRPTDPTEVS
jgi:predicted ribosome quality control (RQC) complex YloA/Tae2 family protein